MRAGEMPANPDQNMWVLASNQQGIETTVLGVKQVMDQYPIHPKDRFAIELILREALINAVTHGSANDSAKTITVWFDVYPEKAMIKVQDDGEGFNWRGVPPVEPDPILENGRGLLIFATYATSYEFNPSGNAIVLWREFLKGDDYGKK